MRARSVIACPRPGGFFSNQQTDAFQSRTSTPVKSATIKQQTSLCSPSVSVMQSMRNTFGSATVRSVKPPSFHSNLIKIIAPQATKLKKLSHYEVKTTIQNIFDKFEDDNLPDALQMTEFLLMSSNPETVQNYFKQVVKDNSVSWETLSRVYNDLADIVEDKSDPRSKLTSVKLVSEWILPFLLTPVKSTGHIKSLPSQVTKAGINIVDMLKCECAGVKEVNERVLVPKRHAMRWVDMLEEEGFLIVDVSSFGDERGVLTEVTYGLDLHDTIDAHRNDPNLVQLCADEAREFLMSDCAFDEVQYVCVNTNEDLHNGMK